MSVSRAASRSRCLELTAAACATVRLPQRELRCWEALVPAPHHLTTVPSPMSWVFTSLNAAPVVPVAKLKSPW
jgi:hypothetical protein